MGQVGESSDEPQTEDIEERVERLNRIQDLLVLKAENLARVQEQVASAEGETKAVLQEHLRELQWELTTLEHQFEAVASSGWSALLAEQSQEEWDWKIEALKLAKPMLRKLKDLTAELLEIDRLKNALAFTEKQTANVERVLSMIASVDSPELSATAKARLHGIDEYWKLQHEEALRTADLLRLQIDELTKEDPYAGRAVAVLRSFGTRGLTLAIAFAVVLVIWLPLVLKAVRSRRRGKAGPPPSRRQLIQVYCSRLAAGGATVVAVLTILYVREDILLFILTMVALAYVLLSFRHVLPKVAADLRLILNFGAVRQNERVVYAGLPWLVKPINFYTELENPLIDGKLRLPLSTLGALHSRPVDDDLWFPSEAGDYLLMSDGSLVQVEKQTPEFVRLRAAGGSFRDFRSDLFLEQEFLNLSRGGSFGILVVFGIDYQHLDVALNEAPELLKAGVDAWLQERGYAGAVMEAIVEFRQAGESSLDYTIYYTFHSDFALDYYALDRALNQGATNAARGNGWTIPFPQRQLHMEGLPGPGSAS